MQQNAAVKIPLFKENKKESKVASRIKKKPHRSTIYRRKKKYEEVQKKAQEKIIREESKKVEFLSLGLPEEQSEALALRR